MSKTNLILAAILAVAIILRFWQLGNVPISLDWDEAALGYNAYSILETGKDEYGNFLPVMLKSFGDYKPALYAYASIPGIGIMGLNDFSVRFPSALSGVLAVFLTFLIVKELFRSNKLALLSALFLALSPWHIQFSRTAFEANLGLTLNLLTIFLFVKGLKRTNLLILSAITSGLSIYAYQSEKIFAPLLMISLIVIFRKELLKLNRKYLYAFVITGLIVISPMLISTVLHPETLNRARSTGISINDNFFSHTSERMIINRENNDYLGILMDNSKVKLIRHGIDAYLSHYDLNWLFITGDLPRHHAPYMGLLYLWELPFILIGLYVLIFSPKVGNKSKAFILGWILISPIPASLTSDVPHAVRTLNFLPTFQIVTALGFLYSFIWLKETVRNKIIQIGVAAVILIAISINLVFYLNQYFVQQNKIYSKEWQYGYEEAVKFVTEEGKDYKNIIVSNEVPLDQSYIFFLYHLKFDPQSYQNTSHDVTNHNFDKFTFRKINWDQDKYLKDTLLIGKPGDFQKDAEPLKLIKYLNGEEAIKIVKPL